SFVVEVSLARNVHGVEYWALLYCFYATSLKFKDTRFEKHGPEGTGGCNLEFQNGVPKLIMSDFFDSTKKLYGPYILLWRCPLPETCMVLSIGLCCIVFMPLPKNLRIHVLRIMALKVQGAATWNFKMVSQKMIMSDFFDSTKNYIAHIFCCGGVPCQKRAWC